jgi:hypothetical protein
MLRRWQVSVVPERGVPVINTLSLTLPPRYLAQNVLMHR